LSAAGEHLFRLHPARHVVDGRRLQHRLSGVDGRAGAFQRSAGDAGLPLRLRRRATVPWCCRGDVRPAAPGAARPASDAPPASRRGAAVTLAGPRPLRWADTAVWPLLRQPHRLRRVLGIAAALAVGLALLIWSLLPTYNMLLIALDAEGDTEYAGIIWPTE